MTEVGEGTSFWGWRDNANYHHLLNLDRSDWAWEFLRRHPECPRFLIMPTSRQLLRVAPLFLFRPAHYLKKFHAKYTPEEEILKSAKGGQQGGRWIQVYRRADVMYANDNVDLPTLNPWVNTTPSPAQSSRR